MLTSKASGNDTLHAEDANKALYDTYYRKPWWWFRCRYDTQIKKRTCLYLMRKGGKSRRNQRVLELGFGSGEVLNSFHKTSEIYGLEMSPSAIEHAERRARKKKFKHYEFLPIKDSFPFPDASFDIVIASHVLEHVPDDSTTINELSRVLCDDGIAVVIVPINEKYSDPNHVRQYTRGSLVASAERAGLGPMAAIENETIFYLVERFYYEKYNQRWRTFGPVVAAVFNFSTAWIPWWLSRVVDHLMFGMGRKPRQIGVVFHKVKNKTTIS